MSYPFIQAANFHKLDPGRVIDLIVLHDMEAPEKGDTAESVARYFQTLTRPASAHYCVDNNSVVQCVRDQDIAFGAPHANRNGLHIEHAGYARQTETEWCDAYGLSMLDLSARLCASLCTKYAIPPVWLTPQDLKAGRRGLTSHHNCTLAFGGTHTDPGPGFPVARYMAMVVQLVNPLTVKQQELGLSMLRVLYGLPLPLDAKHKLDELRDCACWPPR